MTKKLRIYSNRKILAIGGAVIKTARKPLLDILEMNKIEMLIHNGGSIFHDFQLSIDPPPDDRHSYPLSELITDYSVNKYAMDYVSKFIQNPNIKHAPKDSITRFCLERDIPVLMFTALGADFWNMQASREQWLDFTIFQWNSMRRLITRFGIGNFHYICMGSAVIHPEVFIKCVAITNPVNFKADVVDFKEMYRPRTRVACFGQYYRVTHEKFLKRWKENRI